MSVTAEDLAAMRATLPNPPGRRAIRAGSDRTQEAVAEKVGVSQATIALWESEGPSGTDPNDRHLAKYFQLLVEMEREAEGEVEG